MIEMLVIKDLQKTYANGVKALDSVTLSIPKGLFGLLGPNGAGKSSLMRTIATLQGVDSGSVYFDGIDLLNSPTEIRYRLGYLPQSFGVYPRISAADLLDHLAILKGITDKKRRKETVDGLLAHTNLYQDRKRAVSGFSGGMRQRFGIAQALLGDPDLLIVDEPTAGLDPEERHRFHNLLVKLGEEKVVILSTHIVDDVSELCANMAMLASGQILLQGNPVDLIENLDNNIWCKTVGSEELQELRDTLPVISAKLMGGKTKVHILAETAPAGFESTIIDLEDVYFSTLYRHRSVALEVADAVETVSV
jgi:ABC-2 type transport system ATP-binding protein